MLNLEAYAPITLLRLYSAYRDITFSDKDYHCPFIAQQMSEIRYQYSIKTGKSIINDLEAFEQFKQVKPCPQK